MFLGWNRLTEKFTCSDFRGPLFCSNLTWAGNPPNLVFSIIYCNIFYITGITLNYIFSSFQFYISVIMNLKDKTRQLTAFSCFHKPALYLWPDELSYFELLKRVPDSCCEDGVTSHRLQRESDGRGWSTETKALETPNKKRKQSGNEKQNEAAKHPRGMRVVFSCTLGPN